MPFTAKELQDVRQYIEAGGSALVVMHEGGEAILHLDRRHPRDSFGGNDGLPGSRLLDARRVGDDADIGAGDGAGAIIQAYVPASVNTIIIPYIGLC